MYQQPTLFDLMAEVRSAAADALPPIELPAYQLAADVPCGHCGAAFREGDVRLRPLPNPAHRSHYCSCPSCDHVTTFAATDRGTVVFRPHATRNRATRAVWESLPPSAPPPVSIAA